MIQSVERAAQILEVGAAIPWNACALGHAIVAHLPEAQRTRALAGDLARLTGQTKTTRAGLSRVLAKVRQRGYAIEDQEATVGDAGIAAPIWSRDGVVAGAIGVVGAAGRLLAPALQDELVRAVTETARAISREMGASRGGVVVTRGARRSGLRLRRRPARRTPRRRPGPRRRHREGLPATCS
jgi:DNA-binding IclR family transcriptional regulator